MTCFTTSTLALILAAGTAAAESHVGTGNAAMDTTTTMNNSMADAGTMDSANLIRTRDMTGGPVYSLDAENGIADWPTDGYDAVDTEWDQIGEIEDIVLTRDGQMAGVVAEVGGFLDIGDSHVFLRVQDVRLVPVDDVSYALVVRQSEDQLEEMENVDEGFWN